MLQLLHPSEQFDLDVVVEDVATRVEAAAEEDEDDVLAVVAEDEDDAALALEEEAAAVLDDEEVLALELEELVLFLGNESKSLLKVEGCSESIFRISSTELKSWTYLYLMVRFLRGAYSEMNDWSLAPTVVKRIETKVEQKSKDITLFLFT